MKIVSIILARGGSKGIPKKNIININGKPLIQYSIEASQKSCVKNCWVSTDCSEIKQIAHSLGTNVLDRPENLATDTASSDDALVHFSKHVDFDILVFIQPTSPLIESKDIDAGLDLLLNSIESYDSIFSCCKEHWIPKWSLDIKPYNWDIMNRPRRQDMPEQLVENGALYITTKKQLLKSQLRYGGKIGYLEMPLYRSFQIDTLDDIELIKKIL